MRNQLLVVSSQLLGRSAGRAIVLGLIVLLHVNLAHGQVTDTAFARLDARVSAAAEEKKQTARYFAFEVAFPKDATEAFSVKDNALLILRMLTHDQSERPIKHASIQKDGQQYELTLLRSFWKTDGGQSETSEAFGAFQEDQILALPLNLVSPETSLLVEVSGQGTINVGQLPAVPASLQLQSGPNAPLSKDEPALWRELALREFPRLMAVPQKVRISQGVAAGLLKKQVAPHYPPDARYNHVTGSVVLWVVIGKDGGIQEISLISGQPELAQAAIDAADCVSSG